MKQVPWIPVLFLALLLAPSALAADKAKNKGLPEDFELKDDFNDGDLQPLGFGKWFPIDDKKDGGTTVIDLKTVVKPGAKVPKDGGKTKGKEEPPDRCLSFQYTLGKKYTKKSGKEENPHAYAALSLGKVFLKSWADLSGFVGISFEIRGEGPLLVILSAPGGGKGIGMFYHSFVSTKKWQRIECLFEDFLPLETLFSQVDDVSEYKPKLQSSVFVALGTGVGGRPGEKGAFLVDNIGFMKKSAKERKKELAETEKVMFGELIIHKPKNYWVWKDNKELKNEAKVVSMHFVQFPMHNDWRVPFPSGMFADPANVKQLERCTVVELQRWGIRDIKRRSRRKVTLRHFKSHRFVFDARLQGPAAQHVKNLGFGSPDILVQVDLIKYRSIMYEIITFCHVKSVPEHMKTVNWILKNLQKWKRK